MPKIIKYNFQKSLIMINKSGGGGALKMAKPVNQKICADQKEYALKNKEDILKPDNLSELEIN